jgi:hypothetical protein
MAGAASSWQDLILFLISRHAKPGRGAGNREVPALPVEHPLAGAAPFIPFAPVTDHGGG